jgi:hypothetical protein
MKRFSEQDFVDAGFVLAPNDATKALSQLLLDPNVPDYPYSRVVSTLWEKAKQRRVASGALFELIVSACLYDAKVSTFYRHASLECCPKLESDLLVWSQYGEPWCIQLTSTLRERYKLADLQAFRMKSSYPNAVVFLLTMDQFDTAKRARTDFESLDELIYCGNESFDLLMERLAFASAAKCERLLESKRTRTVSQ